MYLVAYAISIIYESFTPYVIITQEKKSDSVSREIMMTYFIVSYGMF